jgi:hypothetical protein
MNAKAASWNCGKSSANFKVFLESQSFMKMNLQDGVFN